MPRVNSSMWLSKLLKQTESSMHGARKIHTAFLRDDVAVFWTWIQLHPSRQIRKISRNVTSSARCLYDNGYANLTNTSSFNKLIWIASLYYKSPIFVGLILASTRFKFPIVEDHISLLRVSHFPKKKKQQHRRFLYRAFITVISKLDESSNHLFLVFSV